MLPPASTFGNTLLTLSPTAIPLTGMTNFVNLTAAYMAQVQAGPLGLPGIFILNSPIVIAALTALPPVPDNSWIPGFSAALVAGITAAVIVPGTVTEPAWTTSVVDVNTLPTGAATITTIAVAQATLIAKLASVTSSNNPPYPLAQAIHDATLEFIFNCIGLGPLAVPIPIPEPAQ